MSLVSFQALPPYRLPIFGVASQQEALSSQLARNGSPHDLMVELCWSESHKILGIFVRVVGEF